MCEDLKELRAQIMSLVVFLDTFEKVYSPAQVCELSKEQHIWHKATGLEWNVECVFWPIIKPAQRVALYKVLCLAQEKCGRIIMC